MPLKLNETYRFVNNDLNKQNALTVKRHNYTDISFILELDGYLLTDTATLNPYLIQGAESVLYNRDEYWINEYYLRESSNECISMIGIIDTKTTGEKILPIVMLKRKTDCKSNYQIKDKMTFTLD